ncbi:hypothetical protein EMCRGX_G000039 [Ephydatia muelleri]
MGTLVHIYNTLPYPPAFKRYSSSPRYLKTASRNLNDTRGHIAHYRTRANRSSKRDRHRLLTHVKTSELKGEDIQEQVCMSGAYLAQ